jgi:threonine efflux protein
MLPEFSLYAHDLLLAYSAAFIAIASPGPSNLMVMNTAINEGRVPAIILCLGVVCGSLTWGVLSAIGVAALIATSATALLVVKILGGCYLLYLAARAARSALSSGDMPISAKVHTGLGAMSIYLHGYLMHITNPKAILGWTGIIALGVRPETPVSVVLLLLAGCFLISLTCNLCYAILFSTPALAQNYRKIRRWADGVFAVFFAFAGLKLLTSKL